MAHRTVEAAPPGVTTRATVGRVATLGRCRFPINDRRSRCWSARVAGDRSWGRWPAGPSCGSPTRPGWATAIDGADALLLWDFFSAALRDVWPRAGALRWVHVAAAGVDTLLFDELIESDRWW